MIAAALKKGRLITFDEMHPSMAKLPSQDAAALAYAEVYTLVGWMQSNSATKACTMSPPKMARGAPLVSERLNKTWGAVDGSGARTSRRRPTRCVPVINRSTRVAST
jgi:hypothetical protein